MEVRYHPEAEREFAISDLKTAEEFLEEQLQDPGFRAEWNRTALARAVSLGIISYRSAHGLTQTELARIIGIKQPAVARLEAGETNPSWETLSRISQALGIEFLVDIAPRKKRLLVSKNIRKEAGFMEVTDDGRILVALRS